jgi:tRNA pseudouridine13 synthase
MRIKQQAEDFIVEELYNGKVCTVDYKIRQRLSDLLPKKKQQYLYATLVKRNYTTQRAIERIAKKFGISKSRISYAGTKDKRALTAQRVCIDGGEPEVVRVKDIMLKNFSYSNKKLRIGDLAGNRFTVVINGIELNDREIRKRFRVFIKRKRFKNYFGEQRFGLRENNHLIGKRILKNDFEGAVKLFLTDSVNEKAGFKDARNWLRKNWGDWSGALKRFPRKLGLERKMLIYLKNHPDDFAGAVKRMPKKISLLFVHALQAHIFNVCLEWYDGEELKLVGYESELDEAAKDVLKQEGLKKSDFRVDEIKHLSCAGSKRKCWFEARNLKIINVKSGKLKIRFELDSGCYATVLLYELMRALEL